jgi:hypothetical protein
MNSGSPYSSCFAFSASTIPSVKITSQSPLSRRVVPTWYCDSGQSYRSADNPFIGCGSLPIAAQKKTPRRGNRDVFFLLEI